VTIAPGADHLPWHAAILSAPYTAARVEGRNITQSIRSLFQKYMEYSGDKNDVVVDLSQPS
jgi:hypothetical protein